MSNPPDVDLALQDPALTSLDRDIRSDLAAQAASNLFIFDKAILGYRDITSRCHGPVCVFHDANGAQFKIILMPRDHFKTSLITIGGTMSRIVRDPNGRYLIANESAHNAERMLRAIRQHAESNKVFRSIYSSVIPRDTRRTGFRWNDHELEFNRDWIGPEPTVDSIGMTGAFTSRHYTHITCDDPISEEAVKSEKVMTDTIERFKGFLSLLVKPEHDTITLVGTRWALHDIYSWTLRNLASRLAVYATGVFDDQGEPIFPELMSKELLALKRTAMGEYKFSCLYLNNPRNEDIQDLNVQDIKWWRWASADMKWIELLDGENVTNLVEVSTLDVTTAVDLAPAETTTSDMNAVTTVGVTRQGQMIVLEAWGRRCKPMEVIEHLFHVHRRWHPRVFGIESVAYQKAFKWFLQDECDRRLIYLNIRDVKAIGRKEHRIRGLQPIMHSGRFYMAQSQHLLRNQISDFPLGEHDDVVDSLSMHLQLMQGVLSEATIAKRQAGVTRAIRSLMGHDDTDESPLDPIAATGETATFVIPT